MAAQIAAAQIIEFSRERGFAAQQLYAIFTTPVDGFEGIEPVIEAHLQHQLQIEAEGKLFGAGPLIHEDGVSFSGEGLIIVRVASLDEARAIADRDPMHQAGARTYKIRPWILNEGSFSFTVKMSDRTITV